MRNEYRIGGVAKLMRLTQTQEAPKLGAGVDREISENPGALYFFIIQKLMKGISVAST